LKSSFVESFGPYFDDHHRPSTTVANEANEDSNTDGNCEGYKRPVFDLVCKALQDIFAKVRGLTADFLGFVPHRTRSAAKSIGCATNR
jgi:hypothetical protein